MPHLANYKLFNIQCYSWHIKLVLNLFTQFYFEILKNKKLVAKPEEINFLILEEILLK